MGDAFRILIIDDCQDDRELYIRSLKRIADTRYICQEAEDGNIGMDLLKARGCDCVLLDYSLPGLSGLEILKQICAANTYLPVILMTGQGNEAIAAQSIKDGAQHYLVKSAVTPETLHLAIQDAIAYKKTKKIQDEEEKTLFLRANYDGLTGLANRNLFISRLEIALARSARARTAVAVLFIDLDHFKPINDTYGHDAGDAVLKMVAQRLKNVIRAYDTPARFGGDEFVILLEGVPNPRDAASIAAKIGAILALPISYQQHQLEISASMGIAYASGPTEAATLIQQADTAMYHAKKRGNCFRFYSHEMQDETLVRMELEKELRVALHKGEFRLYYQPVVWLDKNMPLGVEMLFRWSNPKRGLMPAREFLPAAEAARLMPQISLWMGAQLLRDLAFLNTEAFPSMDISLNLSASQVDDANLFEWVEPILEKEVLGRHRISVDIQEETLTPLPRQRIEVLEKLHDKGVGLYLTHSGNSPLSLMLLHSLPFSLLKISAAQNRNEDRKFSGDSLIGSIILLARHLEIKVAAVGIETREHLHTIISQGCDALQGFEIAHPMSPQQLSEWIRKAQIVDMNSPCADQEEHALIRITDGLNLLPTLRI